MQRKLSNEEYYKRKNFLNKINSIRSHIKRNMDELKKKEYSRLILFQNLLSVIKENIINKTIEDYFNE